MRQKSLARNAVWNFLYFSLNLLFPIINSPYVARVLGPDNLGKVDFATSFTQWFVTFAMFGTTIYGVREISRLRHDPTKMNTTFTEIFMINFVFSLLSVGMYLFSIFSLQRFHDEKTLFVIMSVSILLNAFNIDWFYQGIEEYSYITIRNAFIKIASLIAIFMFIKNPHDYQLYGLISVLGTGLSGILNVINSRKYVTFTFKNNFNPFRHISKLSTFYFITLVTSLYTNLDKTVLGLFDTSTSVAFLARAKMIVAMAGSISTSIAAVAMPRASYYIQSNMQKYKELIVEVPKVMLMLTIPITTGIILLSDEIMWLIGGEAFVPAASVLSIVSFVAIFSSLSTFLQQQVLVPSGNEKYGLIASIISSVISILLNFTLIPKYGFIGAGVALVLAEFTAVFTRYIFIKRLGFNYINFFNQSTLKYLLGSFVMIPFILLARSLVDSLFIFLIVAVFLGAISYFSILYLSKENIFMYLLSMVKSKFLRKK